MCFAPIYKNGPKATPLLPNKNACVSSSTPCASATVETKHSIVRATIFLTVLFNSSRCINERAHGFLLVQGYQRFANYLSLSVFLLKIQLRLLKLLHSFNSVLAFSIAASTLTSLGFLSPQALIRPIVITTKIIDFLIIRIYF